MSGGGGAGDTRAVIEETGLGLRAAVLEDERLVELLEEAPDDERVTDAVFLARVTGVDVRLNAAFLDCGLPEPGFIAAKDARAAAGGGERRPVRELLREGQRLLVQGMREGAGDKGPRFTADVRLFGLALVHTPLAARPDAAGGRRSDGGLRERAATLFPDGRLALRRHAADLPDEALLAEAELLAARWRGLQEAAASQRRPGRLPAPERGLERLVRALLAWSPARIEVADDALWAGLRALRAEAPAFPPRLGLERLPAGRPAFASAGVDEELERALAAEVPLAGGGRIRIEPTAACVAIDVDGGGRAALDVDLEAAAEIALQARLRNLGGSLVVDFVDLPGRGDQRRLEEAVKRAFRRDPLPVEVHALVPALGLVAISRARRGETLAARLRRPCPACGGEGSVPGLRAQAERLLGELRARTLPAAAVRVAPDLDAHLASTAAWRRAAARLGAPPALRRDPGLPPGGFAVEG